MKKQLVNLNKHEIVVQKADGSRETFVGTDVPATVTQNNVYGDTINDVPTVTVEYGEILNVPEPKENTLYIVNMLVLAQAKKQGRTDCIAPDSGASAIRYPKGTIVNGRDLSGQIDAVVQFSV